MIELVVFSFLLGMVAGIVVAETLDTLARLRAIKKR
jgi:hypothetical protein